MTDGNPSPPKTTPVTTEGERLWSLITNPDARVATAEACSLKAAANRLAALVSPALADYLLRPHGDHLGELIDPEEVQRSRLYHQYHLATALPWLKKIAASGIPVVHLKGFATAHGVYPDPTLRRMADVDILIHERDLRRLVELLTADGFTFCPTRTPRWGMISDASYFPFLSTDDRVNIDIHIHPDDFPVHRSLATGDVFTAARTITVEGTPLLIPSHTHLLLLAITNMCRDKFGPHSLNSLADIITLLTGGGPSPDWHELLTRAARGGYHKPVATTVVVLAELGMPGDYLPLDQIKMPSGLARLALDDVLGEYRALLERDHADHQHLSPARVRLRELAREICLTAEGQTILWKNGRRLRGMIRPWRGAPET